jgi:hypothetical protein
VIFEIPDLINELVPGLVDGCHVSVACVRTTRPKYLVFGAATDRPACVVQFGPTDAMEREHHVLTSLHPVVPELVAAPLACAVWRGAFSAQVQSGLPGVPWFRLTDRIRSAQAWGSLGQRAQTALACFHEAVRRVPEWNGTVQAGEELRRQTMLCELNGIHLSGQTHESIDATAELLDSLGRRRHFHQHGDYCINNLLVSRFGIAVIDFEEFGGTMMPWHDEIGLALSLNELSPQGARPLSEAVCAVPMPEYVEWPKPTESDVFRGFILHHLLWRINQCIDRPTRMPMRSSLARAVEQFAGERGNSRLTPARC